MRKQTKILVATALLALGASFTSMAAAKTGTWMLEDDGWYCYDKEGEAYEDEFCLSYGKEYYMGDDGLMVTSDWVDYDEATYYVGSDGSKTVADWRYLVPEDADEDEEAEWFYFDTKGKMVTSKKKVIDGKTYYFADNGVMLTGWVNTTTFSEAATTEDAVWCDENGARVSKEWIKTWTPDTETEDAEEEDKEWYWIKSNGEVQTGRNLDINGQTYFFDAEGVMLHGWVAFDGTNYEELTTAVADETGLQALYFCGGADQGWAKKNTWIKTWAPEEYEEADADNDQYWYYIAKSGKVFLPTAATAANAVTFKDGSLADPFARTASNAEEKEINDKTYAFNEEGQMVSGFVQYADGYKYYGGSDDGAMKTGAIMIEDKEGSEYKFFFAKKTKDTDGYKEGFGVNGAASGELFKNGLIQTADNAYEVIPVGSYSYLVDEDGDIRTAKKEYKDEDGNLLYNAKTWSFSDASGAAKGHIE